MKPLENRPAEEVREQRRDIAAALCRVSRFFNGYQVRALTDASFEVRRGEVFGLLGPKGSGRSTTLKLLAGRLRPTEGQVKVFNRSPRRPSIKARLSYLPEDTGASDNAGLPGFFNRLFAGRQSRRSRIVAESAAGSQRRARLAQVLAKSAELVILDEPFAGLDPEGGREMKELIRTLAQRGKTVIFSSGSLTDARDICDRMAIYFEGRIQAVGTLDQLLAAPDAIRFTAPVLPSATADRVLKAIREEMGAGTPSTKPGPENPQSASAGAAPKTPQAAASATTTAAEAILAPLMKPAPSERPAESSDTEVDPVNHDKLSELTRPATDISSHSKPA